MKAWRVHGVGDIRLDDVAIPIVAPGHALLRIRGFQLSVTEIQLLSQGDSLAGPKWEARCAEEGPLQMFGHEFCGEVVEVDEDVEDLNVGDRVFAGRTMACGRCALCASGHEEMCTRGPQVGKDIPGGLCEYAAVPARLLVRVPASLTDSEVIAMQPLLSAMHFIAGAEIALGDSVAVFGQGVMGLSCLQLARYCGAGMTMGVDVRPESLALSARFGADATANAELTDPTQMIREATDGVGADVVFECAGGGVQFGLSGTSSLAAALGAVRSGGKVVLVSVQEGGASLDLAYMSKGLQLRGRPLSPSSAKEVAWAVALVASERVQVAPLVTHALHGIEKLPEAIEITANKRQHGAIGPAQVLLDWGASPGDAEGSRAVDGVSS